MRVFAIVFILAALLLQACGYHLRGGGVGTLTGMKNIFLQGGSADLREQLRTTLNSSGGKLVDSSDKADMVIVVFRDNIERRAVSLSERGRSNQIELAGRVEYELRDPKNEVIAGIEPIDFRREYFNDQQDVIAKDNEEVVIRNEMYQQVIRSILNRGRSALETKPKAK